MPILTVGNKIFNYPEAGQQPGAGDSSIGYGEDATAWAVAVTEALGALSSPGDILVATQAIANNQTEMPIIALTLESSLTRAANVSYTVRRKTDLTTIVETGTLYLTLNGSTWELGQIKTGDAAITFAFSSTSLGQVIYSTSNMSGTYDSDYSSMQFSMKTLSQGG